MDTGSIQSLGCVGKNSFLVYLCHVVSCWGDRMWAFAEGLYLVIIYPDSLQLTAIYGLAVSISVLVCGAFIGNWIDRTARLKVAKITRIGQNASVAICATLLILLVNFKDDLEKAYGEDGKTLLVGLLIVAGVIANLFSEGSTIALEKDWVVVLCQDDEGKLSRMNAVMRSIDLLTFILAPVIVGQLLTYTSASTGAALIGIWNVCSGCGEYFLLTILYKRMPLLSEKTMPEKSLVNCNSLFTRVEESLVGWKEYFGSPIRNAGLGLAFHFMTVLAFDSVTTGFAYTQGLSESMLGWMTSVAAVFGIFGTICFPFIRKKFGKCVSGNLGFGLESACLILCIVSIFAPGSPSIHKDFFVQERPEDSMKNVNTTSTSDIPEERVDIPFEELWNSNISVLLLMAGIILAHYGLWMADLSVAQIFQETIPQEQRGVINGVQSSLNQLMFLLKFGLVVILPYPNTFGYLIVISWLFVFTGWIFFMLYSYQTRQNRRNTKSFSVTNLIDSSSMKNQMNTIGLFVQIKE